MVHIPSLYYIRIWKNQFSLFEYLIIYTLREEILAGRNIGGFGGFVKNPPKSAKLNSSQNYYFSPSANFFFDFRQLSFFHIS